MGVELDFGLRGLDACLHLFKVCTAVAAGGAALPHGVFLRLQDAGLCLQVVRQALPGLLQWRQLWCGSHACPPRASMAAMAFSNSG